MSENDACALTFERGLQVHSDQRLILHDEEPLALQCCRLHRSLPCTASRIAGQLDPMKGQLYTFRPLCCAAKTTVLSASPYLARTAARSNALIQKVNSSADGHRQMYSLPKVLYRTCRGNETTSQMIQPIRRLRVYAIVHKLCKTSIGLCPLGGCSHWGQFRQH